MMRLAISSTVKSAQAMTDEEDEFGGGHAQFAG